MVAPRPKERPSFGLAPDRRRPIVLRVSGDVVGTTPPENVNKLNLVFKRKQEVLEVYLTHTTEQVFLTSYLRYRVC